METSLVHTRPNTSKIDPFNGTFFKRWQERVYSAIDVVNLRLILTDSNLRVTLKIYPNGKMRTNKLGMSFLAHSQMNSLIFIVNIKLQKKFGML